VRPVSDVGASEARLFRVLAEAVPQLVWIADRDGVVTFYNERAKLYGGIEAEPDGSWSWNPAVHPDDAASTAAAWSEAVATGNGYECEHRVRMADGSYRWHISRARCVRSGPDDEATWFGTATDIHAQKLVEEALRESERRFRAMADNAPVMIWVNDRHGACSFLNTRWYEFTGLPPGGGLGLGWLDTVHPDDQADYAASFRASVKAHGPFRAQIRARRADGQWRWLESRAQPQFDHDGVFIGHIGSSADVTERVQAEAALRQEHEEEHHIAVRLQRALLPGRPIEHPGLDLAATYVPATGTLEVGGDWYETFRLRDGRVGLTVGDVVGHSIRAATAMGQLRSGFLALATHADRPAGLLDEVDEFVNRNAITDFATACCAFIDATTGDVVYASAGHPPMVLIPDDGPATLLEDGLSPPLGLGAAPGRPDATTTLAPGAVLFAYSDGLVERRSESIAQGLERLLVLLESLRHLPATELCRRVLVEMRDGAGYEDDTVVLCVRRLPTG
jgi:PAS domain S-box-containing protein